MVKPRLKILPSGLRVMVIPMLDATTVTVQVFVRTGSENETRDIAGISHFLEHVCFKGTERRPSAFAITSELEAIGADTNAYTTGEYTSYYAKGQARHFEKLLDVVSDIYLCSTFPAAELEKEKGVVVEEMRMYDDMPDDVAARAFNSLLYGDQPAGWPIIGFHDSVTGLSRDAVVRYHRQQYHAANTVVVIAGPLEPSVAFKAAAAAFRSIPVRPTKKKFRVRFPKAPGRQHLVARDTQQAHVVYGFPAVPRSHVDAPALRILSMVLGGGQSSRLFQILREELGLCYYAYARSVGASDHGHVVFAMGTTTDRTNEAMDVVRDQIRLIQTDGVTEEERVRATEFLAGRIALSLESTSDWAGWYGPQELFGIPLESPELMAKKLRAVTGADIKRVARKYLRPEKAVLAVVGPASLSSLIS